LPLGTNNKNKVLCNTYFMLCSPTSYQQGNGGIGRWKVLLKDKELGGVKARKETRVTLSGLFLYCNSCRCQYALIDRWYAGDFWISLISAGAQRRTTVIQLLNTYKTFIYSVIHFAQFKESRKNCAYLIYYC
jgi:hypothetical protein